MHADRRFNVRHGGDASSSPHRAGSTAGAPDASVRPAPSDVAAQRVASLLRGDELRLLAQTSRHRLAFSSPAVAAEYRAHDLVGGPGLTNTKLAAQPFALPVAAAPAADAPAPPALAAAAAGGQESVLDEVHRILMSSLARQATASEAGEPDEDQQGGAATGGDDKPPPPQGQQREDGGAARSAPGGGDAVVVVAAGVTGSGAAAASSTTTSDELVARVRRAAARLQRLEGAADKVRCTEPSVLSCASVLRPSAASGSTAAAASLQQCGLLPVDLASTKRAPSPALHVASSTGSECDACAAQAQRC